MSKFTHKPLGLFCNSGSDYSIVDHQGHAWTLQEAQEAWEAGAVEDYNTALYALSQFEWDVQRLKDYHNRITVARSKR